MLTIRPWFLTALLLAGVASAQTSMILKTRRVITDPSHVVIEAQGPSLAGSGHLLMQFNRPPSAQHIRDLTARGVTVLADVPEDGLLVSVTGPVKLGGLGIRYAAPIPPSDKISPLTALNENGHLLVEFYPDVNLDQARGMVLNAGALLSENPDLGPGVLMISTSDMSLVNTLAGLDAVSYIFPASDELAKGLPVRPCMGALTINGATTQSIPTYGDGWDGPGLGAATVFYYFSNLTSQLDAASAKAEILRAMAQWANAVKITWQQGASATAARTVNIMWGTYFHGDAYPFDGPRGVLAHTFYPLNPNPEPIAGDMHLDDSESWHIGTNTDLYSVTLHELGHALGLGHSDHPSDVMYPYYKIVSGLAAGDVAAIQTMYAAQTNLGTPVPTPPIPKPTPTPTPTPSPTPVPPTVAPLTLRVNAITSTTTAVTINLSGSASGGSGLIVVTWSNSSSSVTASGVASGTAAMWTISNIALAVGSNTITVTATAGSSHVSQVLTVTRQTIATVGGTGPGTDTTPPALTIASPGATSVSTSESTITFSGTASDNVGVTAVRWSTNTGSSGTASGTTNWSASIPLLVGSNVVTIRAFDDAGNVGWRSVVAVRH